MSNDLRSIVEVHRDLALKSSVYEAVPVDVEVLSALVDVAEALRAVADHDWQALLDRVEGGSIYLRGDTYTTALDFGLEGDFETDARHIRPARDLLVREASRAALDRLEEVRRDL